MTTSPHAPRTLHSMRLRDLRVRTKLLLLVGVPFAAFTFLFAVVAWTFSLSAAADDRAVLWSQHARLLTQIDSAATMYAVLLSTRVDPQHPPTNDLAEVERDLARGRLASAELAREFSPQEQAEERELNALLGELVEQGAEVQVNPERAAAFRAFFNGPVSKQIHLRLTEEQEGSESAQQVAEELRRQTGIGGISLSVVIVLAGVAISIRAARRFGNDIARLEKQARRVASGDLDHPIYLDSRDELGQLAQSMDQMVETLRRQRKNQLAFLVSVAHDFRGPLGVVQLATEVSLKSLHAGDEKIRRSLELISRSVQRLTRLAGDLIDASRIEAGEFELHLERCDVRDIARDITDLYATSSTKHALCLSVPNEPLMVVGDPTRLAQVLENLVTNAIKYSPAGGSVDIRVRRCGDEVELSVTDQGEGIEETSLQKIFEPFRRIATKDGVPGVGLGLAIVRRLVEAHRGTIDVESVPKRGSTFRVRVPLA